MIASRDAPNERYLARGGEDGHAIDDWLMAERELRDGPDQNT